MRKEKFVYNTQTLRYEKVVEPLRVKILRILGFVSALFVTAIIIIAIAYSYFPTPKEKESKNLAKQQIKTRSTSDNTDLLLNATPQERAKTTKDTLFNR